MDSRRYDELMKSAFDKKLDTPKKVVAKMQSIEKANNAVLSKVKLENPYRTPTADELLQMRQYAIDYKKAKPKASRREIRNAVKEKFNIAVIPSNGINGSKS